MRLILASTSRSRKSILESAGIEFEVEAPEVDEAEIKAANRHAAPDVLALGLAGAKAESVSRRRPDALVIGADQVLVCGGRLHDKPRDRDEARDQLMALRGRSHRLISAAVLATKGKTCWQGVPHADLAMRPFSDQFLENYLTRAGSRVLASVGGYEIEALGAQLFERIEGDHFTVRGLPLLELMAALRERGVLAS